MGEHSDLTTLGREIVESNAYMTLGTADADGLPWTVPVYFAFTSFSELVWVSRPEARHSRNIAVRPEVGIAIFDSRQPLGTGKGFYMAARAQELTGHPDFDRALDGSRGAALSKGERPSRATTSSRRRGFASIARSPRSSSSSARATSASC
jgi:hypothetical protein